MSYFLAAAAIVTTAYSAWNEYQEGRDQAEAYKNANRAKRRQAQALMKRAEMNADFTRLEGDGLKLKQVSAFASSGIDIGSGIALSAYEDTARKIERKIDVDRMVAETQRDAILLDSDLDTQRADQAVRGGTANSIGTIGQAAFMAGSK